MADSHSLVLQWQDGGSLRKEEVFVEDLSEAHAKALFAICQMTPRALAQVLIAIQDEFGYGASGELDIDLKALGVACPELEVIYTEVVETSSKGVMLLLEHFGDNI